MREGTLCGSDETKSILVCPSLLALPTWRDLVQNALDDELCGRRSRHDRRILEIQRFDFLRSLDEILLGGDAAESLVQELSKQEDRSVHNMASQSEGSVAVVERMGR